MSISSALQAGVSGLQAQSSRLSAISDNIANSATVGYKRNGVSFSTLVMPQTPNGYSSGGVQANAFQEISRIGVISQSSYTTDMAISGRGFFAVSDRADGAADAKSLLTRAADFRPDQNGFLKNSSGYYLMGFKADPNGTVGPKNRETFADLEPVNIDAISAAGQPSTYIDFSGNLPAQETGPDAPAVPFTTSAEFFDPLGNSSRVFFEWQPSATENMWTVSLTDGAGNTYGSADVEFHDSGPQAGAPLAWTNVTAGGYGGFTFDPATGQATIDVPNGTVPQQISLSLGAPGAFDGVTQFSGTYSPKVDRDGAEVGQLSRVEVDEWGNLHGIFDNGSTRLLYQIPVADVVNADGLSAVDGNAYQISMESGDLRLWDAGSGPAGQIAGGAIEGSNVDIAQELTQLMETQRAYSTNARVVTTSDEMLDETTRLKR